MLLVKDKTPLSATCFWHVGRLLLQTLRVLLQRFDLFRRLGRFHDCFNSPSVRYVSNNWIDICVEHSTILEINWLVINCGWLFFYQLLLLIVCGLLYKVLNVFNLFECFEDPASSHWGSVHRGVGVFGFRFWFVHLTFKLSIEFNISLFVSRSV